MVCTSYVAMISARSPARVAVAPCRPLHVNTNSKPANRLTAKFTNEEQQYGSKQVAYFTNLPVYKQKAAMKVRPTPVTWSPTEKGNYSLQKKGCLFLELANSKGDGTKQFDWENSLTIALSPEELAQFLVRDLPPTIDLYHDPAKNTPDEGKTRKILKFVTTQAAASATPSYSFSLSVTEGQGKRQIFIPVSKKELNVLLCLFKYSLPHLLGMHMQ